MPTYTTKGFTGQYADSVTGLDYYNARYYDPVAGVFLSADSVQGNMQGMNPYGYVRGNPETNTDPTGQMYVPHVGSGGGSEDDPNSNNQSQNQNPVNVWWGRVAQKIDEAKSYLNMHLQLPGIVSGIFKRGGTGLQLRSTLSSLIPWQSKHRPGEGI